MKTKIKNIFFTGLPRAAPRDIINVFGEKTCAPNNTEKIVMY